MAERTFERVAAGDVATWLSAHPQALILDARDAASHAAAHLEGSIRIDGRNHEPMLIQTSRTRPVFVYCYRGNASQTYAQQFADFGFRDAADLIGGWESFAKTLQMQPAGDNNIDSALQSWLLGNGFGDINTAGKHGNTPLMHAAWKGNAAALDHGNATSATCLMYAASSSKPAIVVTLLELGADPCIESQDGFNALDMAASIECLQLLRAATKDASVKA
jgi:ankyrin repeat protein